MTPRDAKEFLIERILAQAERDGITFAEPELRMLHFSETGSFRTEPAPARFDERAFERKIKAVIRNARLAAEESDSGEIWDNAVEALRWEDPYLPGLIDLAGKPLSAQQSIKAILIASGIIAVVAIAIVAVFRGSLR
jgi:hypothetical protein